MSDQDHLLTFLDYDPETGIFTWKWRASARGCWNARYAGTEAGTTAANGYRVICVSGRRLYAHRIAWLLHRGSWPVDQIDHIDGCRVNNSIKNLRPASAPENARNVRTHRDNASGLKGIYLHRSSGLWHAAIMTGGIKRSLGYFQSAEVAHAAYVAAATRDHREFARPE